MEIAGGTPALQKSCASRNDCRNEKDEMTVEIDEEGRDV
jgi:hypothetical protein